jgi:hypothetical protein
MSFNQDGVTKEQILKSLKAMIIEGGFKADSIIIDGFDFSRSDKENNLNNVKAFAAELGVSIWYSCSVKDDDSLSKENIPAELDCCISVFDVVIILQPKHDYVELSVFKDRDSIISKPMAMKLDPKTLLILEA